MLKTELNDEAVAHFYGQVRRRGKFHYCPLCSHKTTRKGNLKLHLRHVHRDASVSALAVTAPIEAELVLNERTPKKAKRKYTRRKAEALEAAHEGPPFDATDHLRYCPKCGHNVEPVLIAARAAHEHETRQRARLASGGQHA